MLLKRSNIFYIGKQNLWRVGLNYWASFLLFLSLLCFILSFYCIAHMCILLAYSYSSLAKMAPQGQRLMFYFLSSLFHPSAWYWLASLPPRPPILYAWMIKEVHLFISHQRWTLHLGKLTFPSYNEAEIETEMFLISSFLSAGISFPPWREFSFLFDMLNLLVLGLYQFLTS